MSYCSMNKIYSGVFAVKQPTVRQDLVYSLSDILPEEMVVKFFFLNEFIVSHCTTGSRSLFHSLTMSLVKKNFVQSSWTCLHLSFTPLFLVRDVLSIENIFLTSTFANPLRILKHLIIFPRSLRFLRENKFSRASLSSYDLLRKGVIIYVALRWTASSFAISLAW